MKVLLVSILHLGLGQAVPLAIPWCSLLQITTIQGGWAALGLGEAGTTRDKIIITHRQWREQIWLGPN